MIFTWIYCWLTTSTPLGDVLFLITNELVSSPVDLISLQTSYELCSWIGHSVKSITAELRASLKLFSLLFTAHNLSPTVKIHLPLFWYLSNMYDCLSVGCAGCGEDIRSGQSLLALDKQWHLWCFTCTKCGCLLAGEYMGRSVDNIINRGLGTSLLLWPVIVFSFLYIKEIYLWNGQTPIFTTQSKLSQQPAILSLSAEYFPTSQTFRFRDVK